MLRFYPSSTHVINEFKRVCSQHFGITESQIVEAAQAKHAPLLHTITSRMPNYHKILLGNKAEIQYHLAGYGVYREEALIRLLGEAVERYALITAASVAKKKLFKASYNELKSDSNVLPWELINIFSERDYAKMRGKIIFRPLTPDDKISWMWCSSLFQAGKQICIPAQCLFTGVQFEGEVPFMTSFSKGCASHTDPKRALRSAVLEAIEADALMVRWFTMTKARRVAIDDPTTRDLIDNVFSDLDVELVPFEYTLPGMPAHAFGVAVLSKEARRPTLLLGTGAGLDPSPTLYRTLIEAVAVYYIGYNGPALQPREYLVDIDTASHANLDSNVAYWADASNAETKRAFVRNLGAGEVKLSAMRNYQSSVDNDLQYLVRGLAEVSKLGVHMDLTPPELEDCGWSVARVFFPELVQMSLPSFPYSGHPRLARFGGVQNELPHPSP